MNILSIKITALSLLLGSVCLLNEQAEAMKDPYITHEELSKEDRPSIAVVQQRLQTLFQKQHPETVNGPEGFDPDAHFPPSKRYKAQKELICTHPKQMAKEDFWQADARWIPTLNIEELTLEEKLFPVNNHLWMITSFETPHYEVFPVENVNYISNRKRKPNTLIYDVIGTSTHDECTTHGKLHLTRVEVKLPENNQPK